MRIAMLPGGGRGLIHAAAARTVRRSITSMHVDRLASIVADGLPCGRMPEVVRRGQPGTTIGMSGHQRHGDWGCRWNAIQAITSAILCRFLLLSSIDSCSS